jgi:hypothetical protein
MSLALWKIRRIIAGGVSLDKSVETMEFVTALAVSQSYSMCVGGFCKQQPRSLLPTDCSSQAARIITTPRPATPTTNHTLITRIDTAAKTLCPRIHRLAGSDLEEPNQKPARNRRDREQYRINNRVLNSRAALCLRVGNARKGDHRVERQISTW